MLTYSKRNDEKMKKSLIEKIKMYFNERKEVAFAFLFGSQALGNATKLSNVDIAVYFYPRKKGNILEYEAAVFYPTENEIWADLETSSLLVLNRVPATVAVNAIRGIALAINDWGIYLDFLTTLTSGAIDFRELIIKDFLEKG